MKQKTTAHWIIKLNNGNKLHVSEGNKVNRGDKLISLSTSKIKVFSDPKLIKLSTKMWDQLNEVFKGKVVNKGEIIYKFGNLFPTIIVSPDDGIFLGIDEFGNMKLEIENKDEVEIKSPVTAKVAKIDDEKMTLEFEAVEFEGQGIIEGKAWGDTDFRIVNNLVDLNYKFNGNVILSNEFSSTFLTKAEVLGVTGFITNKKDLNFDKIETKLPVLVMDEIEWGELLGFEGINKQVLMNTKLGRLLIVIE